MSYDARETSVELGKPVELYLFQSGSLVFAYTSGTDPVTYNSIDYQPIQISREEPDIVGDPEVQNLMLTMPADDVFVFRYRTTVPGNRDRLTVYRRHANDGGSPETIFFWSGEVSSVAFQGDEAKVGVEPTGSVMRRPVPRRTFSNSCSHVHYDRGCKVNDASPSFRFDVIVVSISGSTITVQGTGIGGQATDFFNAGFLRQGTLDHRMVLDSTDLGSDTIQISLLIPFEDIEVGEIIQLFAGCDHSFVTCASKFNNAANYGGFPWVPTDNPFQTGID